jgi:hypothetical protein
MLQLADGNEVMWAYEISLEGGEKSTGSPMYMNIRIDKKFAGQAFTLVHKKSYGTFEYYYDNADSNGNLKFGPLNELSPFMLVKGTLNRETQKNDSNTNLPTGDDSTPWIWLILGTFSAAGVVVLTLQNKRKKD